jgi:hypothetical protein
MLETDGIPTTQISLVREHTVVIQPPRALWVPFELGRPLGVPGDAAFQTRVLRQVLQLLEAPSGPVLEDYPEEAPALPDDVTTLVCPVNFAPPVEELSDTERLRDALQQEIARLRTWYDLAVSKRGRTTVGVSKLSPEAVGAFIGGFLEAGAPDNPRPEVPLATLFRYAVEDLKTYYGEAMTAQPGQNTVESRALATWFWRDTTAGKVLFAVHEACKRSDVPGMQVVAAGFLIPRAYSEVSPYAKV